MNEDVWIFIAAQVYDIPEEEVTDQQRYRTKLAGFTALFEKETQEDSDE